VNVAWCGEKLSFQVPLRGLHNVQNAAVALAAALFAEVPRDAALDALSTFPGVARRMEIKGEAAGITVVDDFAHHPTALAATIAAAREQWPQRRLVVAFEPRSLTAGRRSFQDAYAKSLEDADVALVAQPYHRGRLAADELLDLASLARTLSSRGVEPVMPEEGEDPVSLLKAMLRPGDVVLGCSSGDFGGFHTRLLEALASEGSPAA
jgi:UDP-N-acetylmuramate: L-alanyl-gamma-D-glutamyl-meso-diaminopimelate ligase